MQSLDYGKGWLMHTGFYYENKFHVVLTDIPRYGRYNHGTPNWVIASFDGTRTKPIKSLTVRQNDYNSSIDPMFISHAEHGMCAIYPGRHDKKIEAVIIDSGKKFTLYEGDRPDLNYWQYRDWLRDNFTLLANWRYQNVRAVWNDSLVVMTGKEAESRASLVMGPTEAANVLATKGLSSGCVVAYKRGGGHRILKPSRHSLTHLVLANDGCVFMCATTSNGAYLFDFDA